MPKKTKKTPNEVLKPISRFKTILIPLSAIRMPEHHRSIRREFVALLAVNIASDKLRTPISVLEISKGKYEIVAGVHRFKAFQKLERTSIPCIIIRPEEAEGWSIAENVLRNEPDYLSKCCGLAQLAQARIHNAKSKKNSQPNNKGIRKISEGWAMTRPTVSRMLKVAEIDSKAQVLIRKYGLSRKKSLLLEIAALPDRASQIQAVLKFNPNLANEVVKEDRKRSSKKSQGNGKKRLDEDKTRNVSCERASKGLKKSDAKVSWLNAFGELEKAWKKSDACRHYREGDKRIKIAFVKKMFDKAIISKALREMSRSH